MGGTETAIEVRDLAKSFRIPVNPSETLKERAVRPWRRARYDQLEALRGLSFDVARGEFFGVVGRNGSGKSTLLKLLASIYRPDAGTIRVAGDIAPFIELAVGFNVEFSAHDNVLLNGVMMGLTRREAERRFDAVMEFAELEEYSEMKLKNYSSGMLTRLAFSIMVQVDADVMLIDEVLAVGDASFQRKCFEVFERLRGRRTVVFVTHDMSAVERFCDRAMLLDRGRIAQIGDPGGIARSYVNLNAAPPPADEDADAIFTEVWVETASGERPYSLRHGEEINLNATVEARRRIERPRFAFQVRNSAGAWIYALPYMPASPSAERLEGGERVRLRAVLRNPLAGGSYSIQATLISAGREDDLLAVAPDAVTVVVSGPGPDGALVAIEDELRSEAVDASEVRA